MKISEKRNKIREPSLIDIPSSHLINHLYTIYIILPNLTDPYKFCA